MLGNVDGEVFLSRIGCHDSTISTFIHSFSSRFHDSSLRFLSLTPIPVATEKHGSDVATVKIRRLFQEINLKRPQVKCTDENTKAIQNVC